MFVCKVCGGRAIRTEEYDWFMHADHGERVTSGPGDWRGLWCNRAGTTIGRHDSVDEVEGPVPPPPAVTPEFEQLMATLRASVARAKLGRA